MLLDKVLYHLSQSHFALIKTLYFNFKLLPFHIAIKLPILIYGPVKLFWLKGKCEIKSDRIFRGMIKLGRNNEFFNGVDGSAFISMASNSKLIFEGPCAISNNYKIRIENGAVLRFGAYTFFGSSIKFVCTTNIYFGKYTRCAYESQIIDTNSHFVLNEKSMKVAHRNGKIIIGEYNWIGNRTTINKGAHTKDYTIICANSMVNKDFSNNEENNIMLGGCPAKIITDGLHRIFDTSLETRISNYFRKNPDEKYFTVNSVIANDTKSIEYWFENIM